MAPLIVPSEVHALTLSFIKSGDVLPKLQWKRSPFRANSSSGNRNVKQGPVDDIPHQLVGVKSSVLTLFYCLSLSRLAVNQD